MNFTTAVLPKKAGHDKCLKALYKLASFDYDITGKNGYEDDEDDEEYNAPAAEYGSIIEQYFEESKFNGVDAVVDALKTWLSSDNYYYDFKVKKIDVDDHVVIVVVALEVDY